MLENSGSHKIQTEKGIGTILSFSVQPLGGVYMTVLYDDKTRVNYRVGEIGTIAENVGTIVRERRGENARDI